MKPARVIPEATRIAQARASDPRQSVWVSANAGSGKTHVLAQRVIRLLLDNVDPGRILCLTYTRAAAANMSGRVFSTLSAWTILPDAELAGRIEALDGAKPSAARLALARKLFARALETPGGLKIQTIHAFCEAVLHQFPLEANIAAHFQMIDPLMEQALFAAARRELLTGAVGAGAEPLLQAFATVLQRGGEAGLDDLLEEIVRNRDGLRGFLDAAAGDDPPFRLLFEEFGVEPDETGARIAGAAWPLPGFDPDYFTAFAQACAALGANRALDGIVPDAARGMAETDPERRLALLSSGFLKKDGEPYAPSWVFGKALLARLPDLPDRYAAACGALLAANERMALLRTLENTRAALTVADWLVGRYEQLKAGRGFLDFNDLITRTVRLLARQDAGPWVLYKLDKGIDHILLDEAQDTSPDQWAVVRSLADEFFAGKGSRDGVARTLFAVGDEKQSIYSFQGAAPEAFAESSHAFAARVRAARRGFEHIRLNLSFRSTEDVLGAVDRVFADAEVRRGVSFGDDLIEHGAVRAGAPGYVDLWPTIGADAVEEPDDWSQPIDHATAPEVRLAGRIAATIHGWIASGETIEGTGKRLSPGDVLVLVRKRGSFVNALAKSLKDRHVAVAGADRLTLAAHIAVKDLIALGHVALQPHDDLSLAALLRSPVFGLSEETLFALAHGRGDASLLDALGRSDLPGIAPVADQLRRWADEAAFRRPFEFYAAVLGRDGVRARMIGRLGPEAGEILDEFLSFALAQERAASPDLVTFLATLQSASPEIKREMEQGRDEVRIMTVHASKGLEAPVVFLVDGGSAPFSISHLPRLVPFAPKAIPDVAKAYLWRVPNEPVSSAGRTLEAGIRDRAEEEYRRLLYVGMTRAEDRLIVAGFHGRTAPKPSTWHSIVERALSASSEATEIDHPAGEGRILRFRIAGPRQPVPEAGHEPPPARLIVDFPDQLRRPLPVARQFPRPLAPSGASSLTVEAQAAVVSGRSPVLDPDEGGPGFAIERGVVLHKMLQALPDMAAAQRAEAAARYVARAGAAWDEAQRRRVVDSVFAVLDSEEFAPLFAPGSRAEVAVMGTIDVKGSRRVVSGTIDRLAVADGDVLIVDYKTNRPPPARLEDVPPAYITQLALYRALLEPIYPGRRVAAALLFTEAPRLMAVPSEVLSADLARLTEP